MHLDWECTVNEIRGTVTVNLVVNVRSFERKLVSIEYGSESAAKEQLDRSQHHLRSKGQLL